MCSKEEEPLVLQQFLRFGETRPITQQVCRHFHLCSPKSTMTTNYTNYISTHYTNSTISPTPAATSARVDGQAERGSADESAARDQEAHREERGRAAAPAAAGGRGCCRRRRGLQDHPAEHAERRRRGRPQRDRQRFPRGDRRRSGRWGEQGMLPSLPILLALY